MGILNWPTCRPPGLNGATHAAAAQWAPVPWIVRRVLGSYSSVSQVWRVSNGPPRSWKVVAANGPTDQSTHLIPLIAAAWRSICSCHWS